MTKYKIQHRIRTLSDNAVDANSSNPSFEVDGIVFTQWEFNHADGWLGDAWIAEAEIESVTLANAFKIFGKKLSKIVPRISLISQTYISYWPESFVVTRSDKNFAFFHHLKEDDPVGLMFMEAHQKALHILLGSKIPDEFFLLWNDAVNTTGYTAKILLMASAIESLIKNPDGEKDYELRKKILGNKLKNKLYAQGTGLRNRLSHGEYLSSPLDGSTNYFDEIHKRIIVYFNNEIFQEKLLSESTVHPQRNFIGNFSVSKFYIESTDKNSNLELKPIVNAFLHAERDGSGLQIENYGYNYVFGDRVAGF